MLDLHVSAEVPLQVELAAAVRALEGLAARVQVHVSQEVVHSVEGLPAHLRGRREGGTAVKTHVPAVGFFFFFPLRLPCI